MKTPVSHLFEKPGVENSLFPVARLFPVSHLFEKRGVENSRRTLQDERLVSHLFEKRGVENRTAATMAALQRGLARQEAKAASQTKE